MATLSHLNDAPGDESAGCIAGFLYVLVPIIGLQKPGDFARAYRAASFSFRQQAEDRVLDGIADGARFMSSAFLGAILQFVPAVSPF